MSGQSDIGWKQFSTNIFELIRWPLVVLVIAIVLQAPVGRLLDAITISLKS